MCMLHTALVIGIYSTSEMTTWAVYRGNKSAGNIQQEYRITHLWLINCYFDNLFIGNVIETGGSLIPR